MAGTAEPFDRRDQCNVQTAGGERVGEAAREVE
jgi:hypothetical protein